MSKTETQSEAPISKLREAFEFDLIDNHAYTAPDLEKRDGYYADDEIQFAWEMAVVAWEAAHASTSAELLRLDAENKGLRADAERYRWLREQNWHDSDLCVVRRPRRAVKPGHDCPSGDRLDEFCDAGAAAQAAAKAGGAA